MHLSIIAALANNRVIGIENRLPWHLPADLKYFKSITMGKPIIMGRKTYESIGKPLPGRRNIIVSRNTNYQVPGCEVAHTLDQALALVKDNEEAMLIGGAQLFTQALPQADRLYLTFIHQDIPGDSFFPEWSAEQWQEISRVDHQPDQDNAYHYSFVQLARVF